jgi:hypothetical protein
LLAAAPDAHTVSKRGRQRVLEPVVEPREDVWLSSTGTARAAALGGLGVSITPIAPSTTVSVGVGAGITAAAVSTTAAAGLAGAGRANGIVPVRVNIRFNVSATAVPVAGPVGTPITLVVPKVDRRVDVMPPVPALAPAPLLPRPESAAGRGVSGPAAQRGPAAGPTGHLAGGAGNGAAEHISAAADSQRNGRCAACGHRQSRPQRKWRRL